MATPPPENPSDDDRIVRAAEAALGLGPPNLDPELDRAVAQWEQDFAGLADELAPVPPRPAVWAAIQAAITPPAAARPRLAANLNLWRGLTAASLVAAVLAWTLPRPEPARTPDTAASFPARPFLATPLTDRDGAPLYVAAYDPARSLLVAIPVGPAPPAGRTARLWLAAAGEAPVPVATLGPAAATVVTLSGAAAALASGPVAVVVTFEPAGAPLDSASDGVVAAHGRFVAY